MRFKAVGRVAVVGLLSWPGLLAAQPPRAPEPPAPETTGTIPIDAAAADEDAPLMRLEDVVVTATKRPVPLREVPSSIALLEGDELEEWGVFEMRDYLRTIPGIALTELSPSLARISVRGIQLDSGSNTPDATGIFIDDVPLNDPFLNQARPDLPAFDLEGIEVLKGPQGTFFGGSALGGAVRYRLADAQPGEWEGRTFANYQVVAHGAPRHTGGAALNVPLGASGAVRLAGVRRNAGGVIDDVRNSVADTDSVTDTSGRAIARWDFGERATLRLKALQQDVWANDLPVAENVTGRLERGRALRAASPSQTRFDLQALDLDWRLGWADFGARSSVLRKRAYYQNANAERTLAIEDTGQPADSPVTADIDGVVHELRLASPLASPRHWQWIAGVYRHEYASFTTQRLYTRDPLTGAAHELLNFVADVKARELSVFGETSLQLGERWRVAAGARHYTVESEGTVMSTGAIILATGSPENRNDAAIEADGLNPKLTLQFAFADAAAAYASASRGFRFGGIQIVGPSPTSPDIPRTYSPDSLWSYEIGLRTQWLADTLRADVAAFHIDWDDPQINTISDGAVPLNVLANAGGARSRGGEVAVAYLTPIPGFSVDVAAAYTDARTTAPFKAAGGAEVPAGARLPGYAQSQVLGQMRYRIPIGPLALETTLRHAEIGKGVSDILQSLPIYDYATTDAHVALWHGSRVGWPRLIVGVTNLGDERAVVSALVIASDNYTTVYNRPRTYEVRLDFTF